MRSNINDCPPVTYYQADLIQNHNDGSAMQLATQDAIACASIDPSLGLQTAQNMARSAAAQALAVGEQDSRVALLVLKDIARRMASTPGERMMVMITGGFFLTDFERRDEIDLIDSAIRSNVMINSLDARGLYTSIPGGDASVSNFNKSMSQRSTIARDSFERSEQLALGDIMGELSDGTGGIVFQNNNDLRDGYRRTTQPPEFIYLLGFSPQNLKLDGAYHTLKVSFTLKEREFAGGSARILCAPARSR